ncbi:hypothetical protein [Streptomyces indicus]|uniref:Uncharacterized protein n=1 Tax=Streptomyces indicus TaxID=417292 RepID=A0A1G8XIS5_9ACTN|nr:hypothetical protein [Streptomyces indicus]SDJ89785.1 hypothetical protein SAMN05421806_103197 [Streptomyces indicus]
MNTTRGQAPAPPATPSAPSAPTPEARPAPEARGCLFALSQPPLMIFLGVIGCLLLAAAIHDLFLL